MSRRGGGTREIQLVDDVEPRRDSSVGVDAIRATIRATIRREIATAVLGRRSSVAFVARVAFVAVSSRCARGGGRGW